MATHSLTLLKYIRITLLSEDLKFLKSITKCGSK